MAAIPVSNIDQSSFLYVFQPISIDIKPWLSGLNTETIICAIRESAPKQVTVCHKTISYAVSMFLNRWKSPSFMLAYATT